MMWLFKKKNIAPPPKVDAQQDMLSKLYLEHDIVTLAIKQMREGRAKRIISSVNHDVGVLVHTNLVARRVEIELMIDALTELKKV